MSGEKQETRKILAKEFLMIILSLVMITIMIKNLYSAKTIQEYSKALYINPKLKFKIPKNLYNSNDMLCYGKK